VLRVTVRGPETRAAVLGSGETLLFGRSPEAGPPEMDPETALRRTVLALPHCAPHVSRLVGELVIGAETVRLRWHGGTEAQLSSLFDAPGGARRVTLVAGMSALLDEGENHLLLLRGKTTTDGTFRDLLVVVDVAEAERPGAPPAVRAEVVDRDEAPTAPAPRLEAYGREWFVALALSEPWLVGTDDYPRPPSNREIYERVLGWHGYAWNLDRAQRVDDAIRAIARLAFGPDDDPFAEPTTGRVQNVRFAVGRRAAEVRLVTAADLEQVLRAARDRGR
jgi:hypothetical protein